MIAQYSRYLSQITGVLAIIAICSCKARSPDAPFPVETEVLPEHQASPPEDEPSSWVQKTLQKKVVRESAAKGLEAFGLFSKGSWQIDDGQYVVTIDNAAGTADLHFYAPLKKIPSIHRITPEDLAAFRETVESFDRQDDYNPAAVFDGFHYNYMHMQPEKPIARLYMNAPGDSNGYVKLVQAFGKLPRK